MVRHGVFAAGERGAELPIPRLLFVFLGGPILWSLHLAVSYFLITLACAIGWGWVGWAVAAVTIVLAGGSLYAAWTARRMWQQLGPKPPEPDERDWVRFVLLTGGAGSFLFTVAIVLQGVAPAFVSICI